MKTYRPIVMMALLALAPACGNDDDSGSGDADGAVPNAEMLSLDVDSSSSASALTGDSSATDVATQELTAELNDAIAELQERIDALRASASSTTTGSGRTACTIWTANNGAIAYRLSSCARDARADRYAFVLEGRPLASTSDNDYVTLAAGHGAALPAYQGGRRGHGTIGYDFDALHTLRSSGPVGKVAVGFRASGRARSLNVAFVQFASDASATPRSARIAYHRVVGVGGNISFATYADVIAPGEDGYVSGHDGLIEYARVALAWVPGAGARVSAVACGGTVGTDQCVYYVQCYSGNSGVTFEDVASGSAPAFVPAQCPSVQYTVDEPPSEGEVAAGADTDTTTPGPDVDEPEATSDE